MTKEELAYILGIVSHFYMESKSITQRRMSMAIIKKLYQELNHAD
jgi:hypothetical protein